MDTWRGIPENIARKITWVSDEHRKNPLSHSQGGVSLVIVFDKNNVYGYDKIKFPSSYTLTATDNFIGGMKIETIYIENHISAVYVRGENKLEFTCVWTRCNSQASLTDELKVYNKPCNRDDKELAESLNYKSDMNLAEDVYGAPSGLSEREKEIWIEINEYEPD